MPKTKVKPERRPDPAGEAWQAEASRRWNEVESEADFTAPPLPAFVAAAHVSRPLFGRYLFDRDALLLHDVTHALEGCGIDRIRNGTFIHFAHELAGALPADASDCACMEA